MGGEKVAAVRMGCGIRVWVAVVAGKLRRRIWLGMALNEMLVAMLGLLVVGALLLGVGDCWAADTTVGTRAAGEKYVRGRVGRARDLGR